MALKNPVRRLGWYRQEVEAWSAPLGDDARQAVSAMSSNAWWIPAVPELSRFRLAPATSLNLLRSWLHRRGIHGRPVVWTLENSGCQGLDDFEVRAVLESFASVDRVWQVPVSPELSRILAVGTLRHHTRAYLFEVSLGDPADTIEAHLRSLRRRTALLVLLVERDRATSERGAGRIARMLSHFSASGRCALAFRSAARDVGDLREELAVLQNHGCDGFSIVCLPPAFPWDRSVIRALNGLGLRAGLLPERAGRLQLNDEAEIAGAYQQGGSYLASLFDPRIPAAVLPDQPWLQLVRTSVDPEIQNEDDVLNRRLARLELLLDFQRMETYLRGMAESISLQQRYHEYRVYNWPAPNPSRVLDLKDAGRLSDPRALNAVVAHHRWRPWSGMRRNSDVHTIAEHEAMDRLRALTAVLSEQRASHSYLEQVAREPLRSDIQHFARFVPASIGRVLELGCGYGQLARELLPRSTTYTMLDLSLPMLQLAPSSRRVAADIHALPFRAAVFDSVIANNVLEHAYDPVQALSEVARTLVPDGALYALIPMDALNAEHGVTTHLWKADRRSVRLALEAAGLALSREELVDLYALGVPGAFPQCNGLVLAVEAKRRAG